MESDSATPRRRKTQPFWVAFRPGRRDGGRTPSLHSNDFHPCLPAEMRRSSNRDPVETATNGTLGGQVIRHFRHSPLFVLGDMNQQCTASGKNARVVKTVEEAVSRFASWDDMSDSSTSLISAAKAPTNGPNSAPQVLESCWNESKRTTRPSEMAIMSHLNWSVAALRPR